MKLVGKTRKDIGMLGERVATEYLRRKGFTIVDRNVARKTGEIDIIAKRNEVLHFVEVKTILCKEFPLFKGLRDEYDPAANLHALKIRKVARTSEWYMANNDWEGESQIDGALVWLREGDGLAHVRYLPQIL
ncbi:YraN family protein [Patescibacteria group bacterium]|nr:YraN family protein [Patescibacteria group bacterium]